MTNSWLEPFLQSISGRRVLELGCGEGLDSVFLATEASHLVCTDRRIDRIVKNPLKESFILADHSVPLPVAAGYFDVIVAGLSLHYFNEVTMKQIVMELNRVLGDKGQLLARLNSVRDTNHGAGQGAPVEDNFYSVPREHGSQLTDAPSLFQLDFNRVREYHCLLSFIRTVFL